MSSLYTQTDTDIYRQTERQTDRQRDVQTVLGPLLFLLYTADVLKIIYHHGLLGHPYANDISIYLHTDASQCKCPDTTHHGMY